MSKHLENDVYSVGRPNNCPFREMNEETEEVWCDIAEDGELDCKDKESFPATCPLYTRPIIVQII